MMDARAKGSVQRGYYPRCQKKLKAIHTGLVRRPFQLRGHQRHIITTKGQRAYRPCDSLGNQPKFYSDGRLLSRQELPCAILLRV